jgi:hypothetical protein
LTCSRWRKLRQKLMHVPMRLRNTSVSMHLSGFRPNRHNVQGWRPVKTVETLLYSACTRHVFNRCYNNLCIAAASMQPHRCQLLPPRGPQVGEPPTTVQSGGGCTSALYPSPLFVAGLALQPYLVKSGQAARRTPPPPP